MHKKTEMKREKSPYTPLKSKAKGKELSPELLVCSLSPRVCARTRKGPARYRLAGEAAEALINILGGTPGDHTLWAYYCYHHDIAPLIEKAYELAARQRAGKLTDAVTAFQHWLSSTFPRKEVR